MSRAKLKVGLGCFCVVLSACQIQPEVVTYSSPPSPELEEEEVVLPPPIDEAQLRHARLLADLLYDAKKAFSDNRLMQPSRGNAYGIYQQVLQLDPGNVIALEGIEEIVQRYVAMAGAAISNAEYDGANDFLNRAARLNADSEDVAKARSRLASAKQNKVQMRGLNPAGLTAKSPDIIKELAAIAQQIKAADATFLIHARNDIEGRWIYKTMRDAVSGYRLRGNIDISSTPGITIASAAEKAAR